MTGMRRRTTSLAHRIGASALVAGLVGCSAGYVSQRGGPRGYLRLEVQPPGAELAIDEVYSGVANGWAEGVVPVTPGVRRLMLRADGYITQRFDIEVAAYEEVTLILALEPTLEVPDEEAETPKPDDPFRPSLRALR